MTAERPERKRRASRKSKEAVQQAERTLYGITIPNLPPSDIPIVSPDVDKFPRPHDYVHSFVRDALQEQATATANKVGGQLVVAEASTGIHADFAVACHRLAGPMRSSPHAIAEKLATNFTANSDQRPSFIRGATAVNGYVNFELDIDPFGQEVLSQVENMGSRYGEQNIGQGKTVVIDCSSPNVAKYMSVGHLRSTVIGESLARIYKQAGYTTIRDNHLGDWGTQFGMLGRAQELWGDEMDQQQESGEAVKGLYHLYVRMHEEVEKEKQANPEGESRLEREGREWFKRLESGDPRALEMLKWATTQSLQEFQRVYSLLGARFEYKLGESFYIGMVPSVIRTLQERGIAARDPKGGLTIEFSPEKKLNNLVVQKSDGTSLYSTRDLATLAARTAWFTPEKMLYVVGGDQKDYFKQVFAAFDQLSGGEGPDIEHVYFGMVSLPEGKMSTRKGRVVFLEDVLTEAIRRAKEKLVTSNRELSPEEIDTVSRQVGVGAVIYSDLGQGRERNIKFDWDTALSMDGNSAPYIQYTHARAQSLLRKAADKDIAIDSTQDAHFEEGVEQQLVKQLARYPEAIRKALATNQPSVIAERVFATAETFNKMYGQTGIVNEPDDVKRNTRLRLTQAAAQVIKNGLDLLCIEAPNKM